MLNFPLIQQRTTIDDVSLRGVQAGPDVNRIRSTGCEEKQDKYCGADFLSNLNLPNDLPYLNIKFSETQITLIRP